MMRINCPQCGFFRDLPDTKAPVTPTMATCPKCRHRFRFRPDPATVTPESRYTAGDEGVSSWRRASAAKQDRQQPPAASWEPMDGEADAALSQEGADPAALPEIEAVSDATFAPPPTARANRVAQVSLDPDGPDPARLAAPAREADSQAPAAPDDPEATLTPSHWGHSVEADRPATHQRFADAPPARAPRQPAVVPRPQPVPPVPPVAPAPPVVASEPPVEPTHPVQAQPGHLVESFPVEPPRAEPSPAARPAPPPAPEAAAPPLPVAPEPVVSAPQTPVSPRDEAAADAVDTAAHDVSVPPGETPPDASKPKPAVRSDGVRDIWARLQAMDDRKPGKPRVEHQRPAEDEPEAPQREVITDPIPWERQDAYGFFPGLFLTLRKILFQPVEFFGSLPDGRPKAKALVFNLLISEFLLLIDFLWSLFGLRARLGSPDQPDAMGALGNSPSLAFLAALLLVPVVLSVGIYLDAWVTHLLLRLFRSAKKDFNETFRVLCYSAAPTVLSAVPVAGQLLSPIILIWYMALQAIGLKKCHEAAYTQTLAAIFIKWSIYLFLLLAMLQSFTPGQ
jgi:hypothetical protein